MGIVVPIRSQHLEPPDLGCGTHMLSNARTHIEVANSHQAYRLGCVVGQSVGINVIGQVVARHILERYGQVVRYVLVGTPPCCGR